jgi:hypothetical protein
MRSHRSNTDEKSLIPAERIERRILLLRGEKVILDRDLAVLYGVSTRNLNKAVSRNLDRFPEDFMIQLDYQELRNLKFQFGTSSWGGTRKLPRAFTEQGVAMLSSVLKSKRAVQVNIEIMRAFVRLRQILASHKDLARKLEELEKKYDGQFRVVFDAIRQLMTPPDPKPRRIGFRARDGRSANIDTSSKNAENRYGREGFRNQDVQTSTIKS